MSHSRNIGLKVVALSVCFFASAVVLLGSFVGSSVFVRPDPPSEQSEFFTEAFANWDGRWYASVVEKGYSFTPGRQSNVAFFPLYPLAARTVRLMTGMSANGALILVANLCTLASFVIAASYVRQRYASGGDRASLTLCTWVLVAMALFPTTFFFRMAYSEATFLLLAVLTLYGISKRWSPISVAVIVGLATAARPVGVILLLPFASYLWSNWLTIDQPRERHNKSREAPYESIAQGESHLSSRLFFRIVQTGLFLLLACWGIILYSGFLWIQFEDPIAWVRAHETWYALPDTGRVDEALAIVSHEPLWSPFCSSCPCYWRQPGQPPYAIFSLRFWNPIFFLIGAAALAVGYVKRWLIVDEVLLGGGLLLLPYLSVGYQRCMEAQGRYAAVVFPIYMVLGQLLARLPTPVAVTLVALSGFLMAVNAGMFAAGYVFI